MCLRAQLKGCKMLMIKTTYLIHQLTAELSSIQISVKFEADIAVSPLFITKVDAFNLLQTFKDLIQGRLQRIQSCFH